MLSEDFGISLLYMFLCPPSQGTRYNISPYVSFIGIKLLPSINKLRLDQVNVMLPWDISGGFLSGVWFSNILSLG